MSGGSSGAAIEASQLQGELNEDQPCQAGGNDLDVDVPNDFHRSIELDLGDPARTAVGPRAQTASLGENRDSRHRHKTP
jgi:hypothetical protein